MAFSIAWAPQQKGLILDGCAGPGGWSEGIRRWLGLHDVGLEWDESACATRKAAKHTTIRVDVSSFVLAPVVGRVWGLLFSPPCTLFSDAGTRIGRLMLDVLAEGIQRVMRGEDCRQEIRERVYPAALAAQEERNSARADGKRWERDRVEAAARSDVFVACLVLEPARYLHALLSAKDPEVPFEWAAFEQVPAALPLWQVYARELRRLGWSVWAGILNSADYGVEQVRRRAVLIASAVRTVAPPEPTHSEHGAEDLFGGIREPWRPMSSRLGWGMTDRPAPTVTSGGARTGGAEPFPTNARKILKQAQARGAWAGEFRTRPSVSECGILQSFPADYPWRGGQNKGYEGSGNAVPCLFAAHVASAASGVPFLKDALVQAA
jgi:DNA (cytosine-5)-methyltransferase 1